MRLMLFFDGRNAKRACPVVREYIRPNVKPKKSNSPSGTRAAPRCQRDRRAGRVDAPHLRRGNRRVWRRFRAAGRGTRPWHRSRRRRGQNAPMPLAPPVMITVRPSSDPYRVKLIGSPRSSKSTKRDNLGCLWLLGAADQSPIHRSTFLGQAGRRPVGGRQHRQQCSPWRRSRMECERDNDPPR